MPFPMLAFSPYSSICATEVPVRQLRAMAQQMASMSSQPKVAHAGLMKSSSPKVSFAARRMSGARRSRQAAPRPLNAASSGARPSQGDPTFELMAAEKRWEDSIREGRVKSISAKAAGELKQDGWVFLDVRPPPEIEKAAVDGAIQVPIYIPETQWSPLNVLKQLSNFGLGGWWLGGSHMIPNQTFMQDVRRQVSQDAKVIVACQKGLRSLSAAEQLSKAGYGTIAWVNGGLDTAKKTDLPVKGADDLRYGGIGGISEALGWTDVQREKSAGFMGGSFGPIKVAIAVLALDGLWFAYDFVQEQLHKGAPGP